jgi:hypothetical protein
MSGSIHCVSTLGSGSTFVLRLPVAAQPIDAQESPDTKTLGPNIIEMPRLDAQPPSVQGLDG